MQLNCSVLWFQVSHWGFHWAAKSLSKAQNSRRWEAEGLWADSGGSCESTTVTCFFDALRGRWATIILGSQRTEPLNSAVCSVCHYFGVGQHFAQRATFTMKQILRGTSELPNSNIYPSHSTPLTSPSDNPTTAASKAATGRKLGAGTARCCLVRSLQQNAEERGISSQNEGNGHQLMLEPNPLRVWASQLPPSCLSPPLTPKIKFLTRASSYLLLSSITLSLAPSILSCVRQHRI